MSFSTRQPSLNDQPVPSTGHAKLNLLRLSVERENIQKEMRDCTEITFCIDTLDVILSSPQCQDINQLPH